MIALYMILSLVAGMVCGAFVNSVRDHQIATNRRLDRLEGHDDTMMVL